MRRASFIAMACAVVVPVMATAACVRSAKRADAVDDDVTDRVPARARGTAPARTSGSPLPETLTIGGPFEVHVDRRSTSPAAAVAMAVAEAAPPASGDASGPRSEVPRREWWCSDIDGVRIAEAITSDAVAYYLALSEAFRKGHFRSIGVVPMSSSLLAYEARSEWRDSFVADGVEHRDVHVVTMSLEWSDCCGELCAMRFKKFRTVVVGSGGQVIVVTGDGPPEVAVS